MEPELVSVGSFPGVHCETSRGSASGGSAAPCRPRKRERPRELGVHSTSRLYEAPIMPLTSSCENTAVPAVTPASEPSGRTLTAAEVLAGAGASAAAAVALALAGASTGDTVHVPSSDSPTWA